MKNLEWLLVTGGAGFIGANFVHWALAREGIAVVNLDKLTYAGNLGNLRGLEHDRRHAFVCGDIADRELVRGLLRKYRPVGIVNFAAESHVDRSIVGPSEFIQTNINGTFSLLEEGRAFFESLDLESREAFRFLQVSTDEVYGSLATCDPAFTETSRYAPNSPYAASKAAADHLVHAYHRTYGMPVLTTNCSNNYGPYQFPEKLIPLVILNALNGKPLPLYGDGQNVRDWLFVADHCEAIWSVLHDGQIGEVYNIGGHTERTNLEVVRAVCRILDDLRPRPEGPYNSLITFVHDRPGHDRRYAMDITKIEHQLDWRPRTTFETGIRKTIQWYLDNPEWVEQIANGEYRRWIDRNYRDRAAR